MVLSKPAAADRRGESPNYSPIGVEITRLETAGLLGRIEVGRLLARQRKLMASDRAFGAWCKQQLKCALASNTRDCHRRMAVSTLVDAHQIPEATATNLGWTGLLLLTNGRKVNELGLAAVLKAAASKPLSLNDIYIVLKGYRKDDPAPKPAPASPAPTVATADRFAPLPVTVCHTRDEATIVKMENRKDALLVPIVSGCAELPVMVNAMTGERKHEPGLGTFFMSTPLKAHARVVGHAGKTPSFVVQIDEDEILALARLITAHRKTRT